MGNTASRRHRRSLEKAVEVLECVADASPEPLDRWSEEKVDTTVDLIQSAMEEAVRRHRHSIAEAVQQVSTPRGHSVCEDHEVDEAEMGVDARIQRAVSAAYSHRSESSG